MRTVLFWQAALLEKVTAAHPGLKILSQIENPQNLSLYVHIWIYRKTEEGPLYIDI